MSLIHSLLCSCPMLSQGCVLMYHDCHLRCIRVQRHQLVHCLAGGEAPQGAPAVPNKRQKREAKEAKQPKPQRDQASQPQAPPELGPPPEPTEYVKNRPRRETGKSMALGHTTESLELVKCCEFVGPPGSGAPLAQPFSVEVDVQASPQTGAILLMSIKRS